MATIRQANTTPPVAEEWNGGLNESIRSALAYIAEGKPDVFSIVKRAWSQGNDANTIKQMLQSLKYPTKDVDNIVSKLEARKASTQSAAGKQTQQPQQQPQQGQQTQQGQQQGQQPAIAVKTGNDYIDALINRKMKSGGKEAAISFASSMLAKYDQDIQTYLSNIRSMISGLDTPDLLRLVQALGQDDISEATNGDMVPKLVLAIRNLPPNLRNQILSDVKAAATASRRGAMPDERDRPRRDDPTRRAVNRMQSIDSLLRGKRKA